MNRDVRQAIRALVGLVERDVAELRDSVAEVDERVSRMMLDKQRQIDSLHEQLDTLYRYTSHVQRDNL